MRISLVEEVRLSLGRKDRCRNPKMFSTSIEFSHEIPASFAFLEP
jgi:hypothetical protein